MSKRKAKGFGFTPRRGKKRSNAEWDAIMQKAAFEMTVPGVLEHDMRLIARFYGWDDAERERMTAIVRKQMGLEGTWN